MPPHPPHPPPRTHGEDGPSCCANCRAPGPPCTQAVCLYVNAPSPGTQVLRAGQRGCSCYAGTWETSEGQGPFVQPHAHPEHPGSSHCCRVRASTGRLGIHRDSEAHRACACSPGAPAEAGEAHGLGLCAVVGGQRVTDHRRELAQHPSDLHSRCACPCSLHTGLGTVGRPPRLSHLAEKEERAGDGLPCFLDFKPPP